MKMTSAKNFEALFSPASIAIVGASESSFWASNAVVNLNRIGFRGALHLVNPKRSSLFGRDCVSSLSAIGDKVDLAYIATRGGVALDILDEAGRCGVSAAIVVAAGFGESGNDHVQSQLKARAEQFGMALLGPNSPGLISINNKVAAYGQALPPDLRAGNVGIILQSGALGSAVLKFAAAYDIGVSSMVCMGNEAQLNAVGTVEYLLADPGTKVIAMFLEQIRDGARFRRLADAALAAGKPIVILKVGRTPAGQEVALAHTGAVAGDDAVVDAVFRQHGIARAHSLEELLLTAGLFSQDRLPMSNRMAVVTSSGGACDIIADRASDEGIVMPPFSQETVSVLNHYLPPYATARNPLDSAAADTIRDPATNSSPMDLIAQAASKDPSFDFVLYMGFNLVPRQRPDDAAAEEIERRLADFADIQKDARIPILTVSQTCLDPGEFALGQYRRNGLFMLGGIEFGLKAIGHVIAWQSARSSRGRPAMDVGGAADPVPIPTRHKWSENDGRRLLEHFEVPLVPARLVRNAEEAASAAAAYGYPVALKICSADIPHKSDVGGVALSLRDEEAVREAFDRLSRIADAPDQAEGVLVSPMRSDGVDMYVGVKHDATFGQILVIGLGGIWIEALKDVALRALPVDRDILHDMLNELAGRALIQGGRGAQALDVESFCNAALKISQAAQALGDELIALETNPLRITMTGAEALDVFVECRPRPPGSSERT